jgi:pyridoxal phosphate enzyme (YggS family)
MAPPDSSHPPGEADAQASSVAQRLTRVRARIRAAEARFGRTPGGVALLAVSKKQGEDKIRAAYAAGQTAFGESYVSEALAKMDRLADLPLDWHFIGRIQSNKTRLIATRFAWVHGLDDPRHARRLSEQRPPDLAPLKAFLQVNIGAEPGKAGTAEGAAAELLALCRGLPRIHVVGLMTLPPPATDETAQRSPFRALRRLRDALATPDCPLLELSMGMSADLEAAIAEGATIVRVGTAVFGPRV